ncbi:MAG: hypothetical protein WKF31_07610 [Thermoleophilaceae bacterium]
MFVPRLRLPSGPALVALDLLVLGWVVLFVFLGVLMYDAVQELAALSTSVTTAGRAVDDTGRAIGSLDVPLVGGVLGGVGQQIQDAGRSVIGTASTAREGIDRLALITGLLVAVLPSLPLLAYYAPPRLMRARETHAVRATLEEGAGDPLLERFLAQRAAVNLSFRELRRVSIRPWRDIEEGRVEELAAAELRRVGVSPGLLARSRR